MKTFWTKEWHKGKAVWSVGMDLQNISVPFSFNVVGRIRYAGIHVGPFFAGYEGGFR